MPAIMRGTLYPTIKAAADAAGRSEKNAHEHLRRYGHLDFLGLPAKRTRRDRCKPVRIAGLAFKSQSEAARVLGVDRKTVRNAARQQAARETLLQAAMRHAASEGVMR